MDNTQLAKASLDDIVFEGRNKAYGAYVIRRVYGKHVTRAVLLAVAFFAIMIAFPLLARMMKKEEVVKDDAMLKVNELMEAPPLDATKPPPPPPPPPDAPPPPPPKLSTVKFTPPVVKKDEEVKKVEEIPDQEDLKEKTVATETVKGNTDNPADLAGLEPGEGTKAVEEVVESKPYTYVEQMPVFPGGTEALLAYIGKNIKYPAMALRNQVEGRVFIKFVVGADGSVTNAEVQKGIGAGCDEESLRVIKNLPKFTPGKQNGRAVPVYYTVPVTFAIK
ncbi:energy transducer TonB [Hymenobacter wooponensis]|uniref:Energy transducer TonB n=2 Tax=Hymenobacter wooponensis TaxID=1525360 RepID=A0A4Z0MGF9_9BACT|nr:energy transducer TonB [Hymenobacter wooponensis]